MDVSIDFITSLPKSKGKEVIFIVIDIFRKYGHFMALNHPFSALDVGQVYQVFKLHGWPRSIVSDRNVIFISNFWKGLFAIHGTEMLLSSTYHPQTDGQT